MLFRLDIYYIQKNYFLLRFLVFFFFKYIIEQLREIDFK